MQMARGSDSERTGLAPGSRTAASHSESNTEMPLSIAALKEAGVTLDEARLLAISTITAREILDSRGNPTVEVDLSTEVHIHAPPMPSTACELRAVGR